MDYKKILFFSMVTILFVYAIYMIPAPNQHLPYLTHSLYIIKYDIISSFSLAQDEELLNQVKRGTSTESNVEPIADNTIKLTEPRNQIKQMKEQAHYFESITAYKKAINIYVHIIGTDKYDKESYESIINSYQNLQQYDEVERWKSLMNKVFEEN